MPKRLIVLYRIIPSLAAPTAGCDAIEARSGRLRLRSNANGERHCRPIETCAHFHHTAAPSKAGAAKQQHGFFVGERAGHHIQKLIEPDLRHGQLGGEKGLVANTKCIKRVHSAVVDQAAVPPGPTAQSKLFPPSQILSKFSADRQAANRPRIGQRIVLTSLSYPYISHWVLTQGRAQPAKCNGVCQCNAS